MNHQTPSVARGFFSRLLDRDFLKLKESGRFALFGKELIEDRPIPLRRWLGLRRQIVMPFAAARYFGEPFKVPGSDHISISKPDSNYAIQHQILMTFIAEFKKFAVLRRGIVSIQANLDRFEEIRPAMKQLVGWGTDGMNPNAVHHRLSDRGDAVEFEGYGELKKVTIDDLDELPPSDQSAIAASNSAMQQLLGDWNAIWKKGQLSSDDKETLLGIASQMHDRLELIFRVVEQSMGGILQDHYGAQRAIAKYARDRYADLQRKR
ncbi:MULTISPECIES: hypothetical protein [unclassified Bradyrhizobium]|uniref:hypothetical protein n=1 Tax=unclassified Bradyrhizobium TaxID=2631580 RepID=UPI001FFB92F3|nr:MULTISPECIES: hypothetical protein [unclassified Bradyrhizobium]MCK1715224.1 hypothetical protein [Bradyrhizobium sp. 143]MCK1725445.1 hypothetical protein [Bradyrhizobium sp. 142]